MCSVPRRVFSTVGDITSTVGNINKYHGGVQYHGGYHDICGGYHEYRTVGYSNDKRFIPTVLMILPTCIMISPWYPVSPTLLKISHGTQYFPKGTQDILPG